MNSEGQIEQYIADQALSKRIDLLTLHQMILRLMPTCELWFLNGKNDEGKIVSNPSIGYGSHTIKYVDGKTKNFYQIGLSANATGISVYILGIADRTYLAEAYAKRIGKATVSGYCIKFKALKDINIEILEEAIRHCSQP